VEDPATGERFEVPYDELEDSASGGAAVDTERPELY